jgi:hypothetical protein
VSHPDSETSSIGWLLFIGISFVVLLVVLFIMLRSAKNHSLDRVDGVGLTETVQRWVEAGKPEGDKLSEFMQDRNDFVVSNRVFDIGGTNYTTLFAVTNPRSHRDATLFVTTNKVLIWLESSGNVGIFSMKPSRP